MQIQYNSSWLITCICIRSWIIHMHMYIQDSFIHNLWLIICIYVYVCESFVCVCIFVPHFLCVWSWLTKICIFVTHLYIYVCSCLIYTQFVTRSYEYARDSFTCIFVPHLWVFVRDSCRFICTNICVHHRVCDSFMTQFVNYHVHRYAFENDLYVYIFSRLNYTQFMTYIMYVYMFENHLYKYMNFRASFVCGYIYLSIYMFVYMPICLECICIHIHTHIHTYTYV